MTAEETFVGHLMAMQETMLTSATRQRLAQALLDWFTAGLAATRMPAASTISALALTCHGKGIAPTFGGGTASAVGAAFANAGIAHLREIDDAHRAAMLHPGVVAISPVLALASTLPLSRRRVAQATVTGYEVALRIGEALGTAHAAKFHVTATAGALGAAASTAIVLGLTERQFHHALGIAATQAAGLWQLVDDDAHESKALHPAMAVRNGMTAAYAAQAGLPGAHAFMTGRRGLYALLSGDGPLEALDQGLDAPARINTATIKAWPCCAQLFTPLDAADALRVMHGITPDMIDTVEVVIFPHALKIAGVAWPSKPVETGFSLRYVLAVLLLRGAIRISDMEAPALDAPELLALAERIQVKTDEDFQALFPEKRPGRVTIALRDGRVVSQLRELRRGDPEMPYQWPELQLRMRMFVPFMGDEDAHAVSEWCAAYTDEEGDDQLCDVSSALFDAIGTFQPGGGELENP